jgi:hypothetical protein
MAGPLLPLLFSSAKLAAARQMADRDQDRRQVMPAARIPAAGILCRPCQLLP